MESSEALVETSVFTDKDGMAILLNDFTWQGERDMELQVNSARPVVAVESTLGNIREWQQKDSLIAITCTAPDPVTVIMLEFSDNE